MKQKGRVTPFTQYLIDGIRVARLEQNISGRKLSLEITGSNPTRIGSIENEYTNDRYSPELLQRAVDYLHMRVEDFFPADILAQDTLQEKTKIPILRNMSIRGALLSLLEEGYFHTPRLRSEITAHYNSFLGPTLRRKDSDFSAQLEQLYNEGLLHKVEPMTDWGEKLIRFVTKRIESRNS